MMQTLGARRVSTLASIGELGSTDGKWNQHIGNFSSGLVQLLPTNVTLVATKLNLLTIKNKFLPTLPRLTRYMCCCSFGLSPTHVLLFWWASPFPMFHHDSLAHLHSAQYVCSTCHGEAIAHSCHLSTHATGLLNVINKRELDFDRSLFDLYANSLVVHRHDPSRLIDEVHFALRPRRSPAVSPHYGSTATPRTKRIP